MAGRDEDAPWLAEAAPLRAERPRRPLLNIVIIVLALAAVAAVALLMLLGRKDNGSSEGYMEADQAPVIEAEPGPFKSAPADRQGMEVEGDGEIIHEAVRGTGIESQIDMSALPEEPIGRPRDLLPPDAGAALPPPAAAPAGQPVPVQVMPSGGGAAPAAAPRAVAPKPAITPPPTAMPPAARAPAAAPTRTATLPAKPLAAPQPVPPKPAAVPTAKAGAAIVQIGAFSSEAKAEEEWARVAGKASLTGKQVQKLTNSAGKTLWRVRGTAADPAAACKAITAANGACEVVKK
jgi:SPOR domain